MRDVSWERVSPSLYSADPLRLWEEVHLAQSAGARSLHFDVMDGYFAPEIGLNQRILREVSSRTDLPIHVHLMVRDPLAFVERFALEGVSHLAIHSEAQGFKSVLLTIARIREFGKSPLLAISPETAIGGLVELLEFVDGAVVMACDPGVANARYIPGTVARVAELRGRVGDRDFEILVDGDINPERLSECLAAGATLGVMGRGFFLRNG